MIFCYASLRGFPTSPRWELVQITRKAFNVLKKSPRLGAVNQHKLIWTSSQRGEAENSPRRCVTTYHLLDACLLGYLNILLGACKHSAGLDTMGGIITKCRSPGSKFGHGTPWAGLSRNLESQGSGGCHGRCYHEASIARDPWGLMMGTRNSI
jgi:hypothetical protein